MNETGDDMGHRLARFECAQETIVGRMALRTDWIWRERRKDAPDEARIAAWLAERDRLQDELDALRFDDVAAFEAIERNYSPELRADFQAHRAEALAEARAHEAQYLAGLAAHEATQ